MALHQALVREGIEVITIAPQSNHTAGSHRITMDGYVEVHREGIEPTYSCSGTPADCVRVGVMGDEFPDIDLVVSGINHGANAGEDILYSGTLAAAAESALLGIPAFGFSYNGDGPEVPFLTYADPVSFPDADFCARLVSAACTSHPLPSNSFISVNLPQAQMTAAVPAFVGRRRWNDAMPELVAGDDSRRVFAPWGTVPDAIFEEGSDFAALRDGFASVSLLTVTSGVKDAMSLTNADDVKRYLSQLIEAATAEFSIQAAPK